MVLGGLAGHLARFTLAGALLGLCAGPTKSADEIAPSKPAASPS